MALKERIRPFVPPIIWSAMSRAKIRSAAHDRAPKRTIDHIVTGEKFSVHFKKVTQNRGIYFVPKYAEHRPASRAILSGEVYEPATHTFIEKLMQRRSGNMIHAGTFFGDMLPTFARYCPATVYAFEPVFENYVLAKLCIEANKLDNVFLQNAGLSDGISIAHIDTGGEDEVHRGGGSRLGNQGQIVGLLTIDSLGLDDVAVIQLDIEGHELPALKGARATIEQCAPVIMIEDNARACNVFLEKLGYRHIRTIPGLFIWARPAERPLVEDLSPES